VPGRGRRPDWPPSSWAATPPAEALLGGGPSGTAPHRTAVKGGKLHPAGSRGTGPSAVPDCGIKGGQLEGDQGRMAGGAKPLPDLAAGASRAARLLCRHNTSWTPDTPGPPPLPRRPRCCGRLGDSSQRNGRPASWSSAGIGSIIPPPLPQAVRGGTSAVCLTRPALLSSSKVGVFPRPAPCSPCLMVVISLGVSGRAAPAGHVDDSDLWAGPWEPLEPSSQWRIWRPRGFPPWVPCQQHRNLGTLWPFLISILVHFPAF
jgi:hypothetical protein